jgi:hypothetical protein
MLDCESILFKELTLVNVHPGVNPPPPPKGESKKVCVCENDKVDNKSRQKIRNSFFIITTKKLSF